MIEISSILQDLGLSEKEVSVYISLLQLGESAASRVSEIANLNRITTYSLLKSLKEKGFCNIYEKNKIQYFKAINPEQILSLLEEKKTKVKSILPLLKENIRKIGKKPEVELYEGKKGITAMLDILLKDAEKNKQVLAYGNLTIAEKIIEYQSLFWRKARIKKKIKLKGIVDKIPKYIKENKEWKKLTLRKINKSLGSLNSYILITENYTAYLTLKGELIGILIKSKEIAEKEKFNFQLLWEK